MQGDARPMLLGSGRPSTCRQAPSSSQPPPTHQPYTMASSSSNQAVRSQPPAPQLPATKPPTQTPWSQQPSQWYSSDFKYTVRGDPWFASSQPAPHTPAETWDNRRPATRSPATKGASLRGRGNAARTQKCRTRGGKASCGGRGRGRDSK
ncbi:hypothetical protein SO802_020885 [Lithocarpus litseifolius]|uniref:Uncharacterized protein n=1 Tax=Lithocarpus litseifolius TaxID=425828 RepID=A0AAW2CHA9_9ROSI